MIGVNSMAKQKSYIVDFKFKIKDPAKKLVESNSFNINIKEIIELERNKDNFDDFLSLLPKDKHGVYVVYDDKGCMYVGETKDIEGFHGRFEGHEHLKSFKVKSKKITLYVIDKKYDNDRLLFEKLKIRELDPYLNKTQNKKLSIEYTERVMRELKEKAEEFIEFLSNDMGINEDKLNKVNMENKVATHLNAVLTILESPESLDDKTGETTALEENTLNTVIYRDKNFEMIPCFCTGGECDMCQETGFLLVKSKCKKCDQGVSVKEQGLCSACRGTGYKIVKPLETTVVNQNCLVCSGTGKDADDNACEECKGEGMVKLRKINSSFEENK